MATTPPTTSQSYRRLLGYARPYMKLLVIGTCAGLIAGGSIFGLLQYLGDFLGQFDGSAVAGSASGGGSGGGNSMEAMAAKIGIPTTREDGTMSWQFLLLTIIGFPLVMFLKALFTYINRLCMRWVGARVVYDLRNSLFRSLQERSLRFWGRCNVGDLITRCVNDTQIVESSVANTIADITRAPFEILAAASFVIFKAQQNDILSVPAIMLVVLPLTIAPVIALGRKVKKHTRRAMQRVSILVERMQENFTGIRVIKAFHAESREIERFTEVNQGYFKQLMKALRAELLMAPMMEFVAVTCAVGFLMYCYAQDVQLSSILSIGMAGIIAYRPIKQLAKINNHIQRATASAERVFEVMDVEDAIQEAPNAQDIANFANEIRFEKVTFSYDTATVLHDVSFTIKKGQFVAFVGGTGSGKTTIANLLARFYDTDGGSITIDGTDLREIKIASLRKLIGIVTQDTVLFNDTISSNIGFGAPGSTEEEIRSAAKLADAASFIEADPLGYDRIGGDKGFQVSGGQKQRISIARNILKNPEILILDEATSALDSATEQQVHTQLRALMENRTVFAIAHRLSTVQDADCIHVLHEGRIVESGTHDELIAVNGRYRELHDLQFGKSSAS